jgi:hypothetical protein
MSEEVTRASRWSASGPREAEFQALRVHALKQTNKRKSKEKNKNLSMKEKQKHRRWRLSRPPVGRTRGVQNLVRKEA